MLFYIFHSFKDGIANASIFKWWKTFNFCKGMIIGESQITMINFSVFYFGLTLPASVYLLAEQDTHDRSAW